MDDQNFSAVGGFGLGAATVIVMILTMFTWDSGKVRDVDQARPRSYRPITKEVAEFQERDGFALTRQRCESNLCVSCFVSQDGRRLLGETWTRCPESGECELLDTTEKKEQYDVPFGACERDEVPPVYRK